MAAKLVKDAKAEERPSTKDQLWERMTAALAAKVNPGSFETWFAPIGFAGCDGKTCSLLVPAKHFKQALLANYADVLDEALLEAAGQRLQLEIEVREPDEAQAEGDCRLHVLRASALQTAEEQKPWLIERLWSAGAVGIVAGPPKALKTWTALEMAISVATGAPCLATFPVPRSGTVLLYAAEEPMPALHARLQALAHNHQMKLDDIDVRVIAVDSLRLDRANDREKLTATVEFHRPLFLILDPLIRLHGLDENQSGPMAELLGYLRALQRNTGTAIAVVHHSRKNTTASAAPGQSLRGSSDLYAFVDSLVSLDRRRDQITLSAEHRSAPALGPMPLELVSGAEPNQSLSLRLGSCVQNDSPPQAEQAGLASRILQHLAAAGVPLTTDALRSTFQVRKQRVIEALRDLLAQGLVMRAENGYIVSP